MEIADAVGHVVGIRCDGSSDVLHMHSGVLAVAGIEISPTLFRLLQRCPFSAPFHIQ